MERLTEIKTHCQALRNIPHEIERVAHEAPIDEPICNTTRLPCIRCNPGACEHRVKS